MQTCKQKDFFNPFQKIYVSYMGKSNIYCDVCLQSTTPYNMHDFYNFKEKVYVINRWATMS